jgi:uncharacterized protein (AIM24 family)
MRYLSRAAVLSLLVSGMCLIIGCSSDDSTGPNTTPPPAGGDFLWSARFGDASSQTANAVAVDASGNVIVAGSFMGTVDFGGGALSSAGARDYFVAKFGPDGAYMWSKRFGNASDQWNPHIAVDASGNVIVAGGYEGAIDFGGGALTSAGSQDICVAKLGSDGAYLWSKRFGDGDVQAANAVAVDPSGNVIITGILRGTTNFGGGVLTSAGINDVFVAELTSTGAHVWSRRFGDMFNQFSTGIAASGASVIVTGTFQSTIDFGGGPLPSGGEYDVFAAAFGAAGAHQWSKRFGDASSQDATGIAVDASGNVTVTGGFSGNINFGGSALTSAGGYDVFVATFMSDGTHIWSACFGDASYQHASAVAADASGNVILVGYLAGTADFGGAVLTSAGGNDVFVAKFSSDGAHKWSKRFGDADDQRVEAVAVDASGNVIAAGGFNGTVDFGGGTLTSAGLNDVFVVKFKP